jgi:hypothetical protein
MHPFSQMQCLNFQSLLEIRMSMAPFDGLINDFFSCIKMPDPVPILFLQVLLYYLFQFIS